MRVLITGVAGFIGSHLADKFIAEGYNVSGYDNLLTGSIENIKHLLDDERFEFYEYDVCKPMSNYYDFDIILHFACPASPKDYTQYPIDTLRVCSYGTHNCLELAKYKNARFILASTSEVYGDPLEHPQKETYWGNVNSIGVRSQYDEGKRFSEALTMAYNRMGVNTGIVRLFNSFGSRMKVDDGRAIPTFLNQAINGDDITIFGDGSQTRSFTYIEDTIDGIFKLSLSGFNLPINIGSRDEITLNQLASEIIEITDSSSKIVYKDLPMDDPKQRKPDIAAANSILKWHPKWDRKEALIKTYKYYKQQ